ncbi:HupE/UreJ family protein [Vibrio parahaemolyticus]|uniref:HupE/UreJ family protein n=1 Tax=Vibrio parahaemolyticus TaxID=670 RepID=UPI0014854AF7|nr:HupE/UreJ family protein [Vibrio parahaemolyticus]MDG2642581.1 HupE/UreJ family protein [Vibrio parahaemolyticus]MDG2996612.1 HupE/UreJ family protein [Vibrio parahaemolyticus]NNU14531.1 HupE/UreJ family protein [Vibrio parahaemolyticus]
MSKKNTAIVSLCLLFSPMVFAHPGYIGSHGLKSGVMHPLTGLDHMSVMIGVGLLASLFGGKNRWTMPLSFIAFMVIGGVMGISSLVVPGVETFIALSVVMMGVMLLRGANMPQKMATTLIMAFAVFHGMAHGAEMPINGQAISYFSGFIVATAGLHIAGIALGEMVMRFAASKRLTKLAGAAIALLGGSFLFS